jgi:hypothetical protein
MGLSPLDLAIFRDYNPAIVMAGLIEITGKKVVNKISCG